MQAIKQNANQGTQIIVFIVPSAKKDRYDALKKYCCIEFPG